MNKKTSLVLIVLFLLFLILPHFVSCFFDDSSSDFAKQENRNITRFPDQFVWRKIYSELEAYYNDRIPFRAILLRSCHKIQRSFFPQSFERVLVGKDDFLFYAPDSWKSPFTQYTGKGKEPINHYCITNIVKRMLAVQQHAQSCGAEFLLVIPPNKINIYPDKLPEKRAFPKTLYFIDQVVAGGRNHSPELNLLYLEDTLREARKKMSCPLYYAQDTHWTGVGAYCGFTAILNRLKRPLPAGWQQPEEAVIVSTGQAPRDLISFCGFGGSNIKSAKNDKTLTVRIPDCKIQTTEILKDQYFVTENPQAFDPGEIVVFHDSFGIALFPYFSAYFRKVHFYRMEYQSAIVEKHHPSLVIFERIARNVPVLYRFKM